MRATYYNPALGAFVSQDTLETPNRYAYVGGNVVNRRDPSGMIYENPEHYVPCSYSVQHTQNGTTGCYVIVHHSYPKRVSCIHRL